MGGPEVNCNEVYYNNVRTSVFRGIHNRLLFACVDRS